MDFRRHDYSRYWRILVDGASFATYKTPMETCHWPSWQHA